MIKPGLFKHYKNRKLYRVLFVAEWFGAVQPDADAVVATYAEWNNDKSVSVRVRVRDPGNPGFYGGCGLFDARWSGNDADVHSREQIVIYVALYDDGRVAARPLNEFAERVDVPCEDNRHATHDVLSFERIGE